MQLPLKNYFGTHVITKSGDAIGKLFDVTIDTETGRIMNLIVKTRGLVNGLLDDSVIISWAAVIELTEDKIIVADASVTERATAKLAQVSKPIAPSPTMMKES